MTDRELLENAAKAAGIPVEWDGDGFVRPVPFKGFTNYEPWNPLAYDGDALQLAVKLGMLIDIPGVRQDCDSIEVVAGKPKYGYVEVFEKASDDPYAATRRAIVRAAAEIGKAMK